MQRRTLAEIFNVVKAQTVELTRLMEGSREDILRSFFGLVNSNGGKFKSEKQASFLLSQTDKGSFFISQVLNFGTSRHSQRTVDWNVTCDQEGVVEITKTTKSKGTELYFKRGQQDTISSKKAEAEVGRRAHVIADLEQTIERVSGELAEKEAELSKIRTIIDNPEFASIRDHLARRIPEYEAEVQRHQEYIARMQADLDRVKSK